MRPVDSSSTIWNVRLVAEASKTGTPFHEAMKRRFGAVPIVRVKTAPPFEGSRSSQKAAAQPVGVDRVRESAC